MFGTQKPVSARPPKELRKALRSLGWRLSKRRAWRLAAIAGVASTFTALALSVILLLAHLGQLSPEWVRAINDADAFLPLNLEWLSWLMIPALSLMVGSIGFFWPVSRKQAADWANLHSTRSNALQSALEISHHSHPFAHAVAARALADAKRAYGDPSISLGVDKAFGACVLLILLMGLVQAPLALMNPAVDSQGQPVIEPDFLGPQPSLAQRLRENVAEIALSAVQDGDPELQGLMAGAQQLAKRLEVGDLTAGQAMAAKEDLLKGLTDRFGAGGLDEITDTFATNPMVLDAAKKALGGQFAEMDTDSLRGLSEMLGGEALKLGDFPSTEAFQKSVQERVKKHAADNPLLGRTLRGEITPQQANQQAKQAQGLRTALEATGGALQEEAGAIDRLDQNLKSMREARIKRSGKAVNPDPSERVERQPEESSDQPEQPVNPEVVRPTENDNGSKVELTGETLRARAVDYNSRRADLPKDVRSAAGKYLAESGNEE